MRHIEGPSCQYDIFLCEKKEGWKGGKVGGKEVGSERKSVYENKVCEKMYVKWCKKR